MLLMQRKGDHGRFCQEFKVSHVVIVWLKRKDQLKGTWEFDFEV